MRQHERVGEPVRNMEMTAERIGERVHGGDRGIGERLSRQHRAQQHRRARLDIRAPVHRRLDRAADERQRLPRQQARDRIIVGADRRIGLDRMHHGVNAGRRRHMRGQTERQLGIEQGHIGQEDRRHDAHLLGLAGGDDGNRRHLGAGAGRCGREDHRQSRPLRLADAEHVGQRLASRREQGDELGGVERRAAAEPDDAARARRGRSFDRFEDHLRRRIGDHVGEYGGLDVGRLQDGERALDDAGRHHAGIGDKDNAPTELLLRQRAEPHERPGAELHAGAGVEDERFHEPSRRRNPGIVVNVAGIAKRIPIRCRAEAP